jgi:hypothetical protein
MLSGMIYITNCMTFSLDVPNGKSQHCLEQRLQIPGLRKNARSHEFATSVPNCFTNFNLSAVKFMAILTIARHAFTAKPIKPKDRWQWLNS